jgi:hypothetical protein
MTVWNKIQQNIILWLNKIPFIQKRKKQNLKFYINYVLISKVKKNVVFELKAVDDSSIDFIQSYTIKGVRKFDSFAVYDNVADGNRFLFFDYGSQIAYITPTCFSGFYPIYSSADFSKMEVLLQNEHSCLKYPSDTLSIDSKVTYVPFNCNNRIIKAIFVPYAQVGKDNKYLTTKDSI